MHCSFYIYPYLCVFLWLVVSSLLLLFLSLSLSLSLSFSFLSVSIFLCLRTYSNQYHAKPAGKPATPNGCSRRGGQVPVSSHPTDTKLLITQKAKKQDMDIEGHKDIQQIQEQQASLQTMMQSYEKKAISREKRDRSRGYPFAAPTDFSFCGATRHQLRLGEITLKVVEPVGLCLIEVRQHPPCHPHHQWSPMKVASCRLIP